MDSRLIGSVRWRSFSVGLRRFSRFCIVGKTGSDRESSLFIEGGREAVLWKHSRLVEALSWCWEVNNIVLLSKSIAAGRFLYHCSAAPTTAPSYNPSLVALHIAADNGRSICYINEF